MSKGIIVMDIPENCEDCPCCHTDNYDFYCKRNGNHVDWEEKPDWCPIRPMPEKAFHEDYCDNGRYDKGWNDCLREIGGIKDDLD